MESSSTDREARYFDRLVSNEGDFDPFTDRGWATLADCFGKAVHTGPVRLLDIGCGTGQSRRVYSAHLGSYTGLDISFGAITTALRRQSGHWLRADAALLPCRDRSYDVVAFSSVLHHLPDRHAALAEACRVLRPGGMVFAFDPNLLHPAMALFRHPRSPLYRSEGVSPGESPLLPSTLRDDFHKAGFTTVRQRCQSDIPYRHVAPTGFARLLPLYNRMDRWWERTGLGRWLGTFVITWGWRE